MRERSKSSNIIKLDNKHALGSRTCFEYMFILVMLLSFSVFQIYIGKIRKKADVGRMWRSYTSMVVLFLFYCLFCLQFRVTRLLKEKRNLNCGPYKINIYPIS